MQHLQPHKQNGLGLFTVLLFVLILVVSAISWRHYSDIASETERREKTIAACHAAVSIRAKYQSKVRFTKSELTKNQGTNNILVLGVVDMMNGFGAMIPHNYMCTFDSDGKSLIKDPFLMAEGTTPEDMARDIILNRQR